MRSSEWPGATSAKFTTCRKHIPAPQPDNNQPHPLFSAGARKHFPPQQSTEDQWKPTLKVAHDKDAPRPEKPHGVKYLNPTFGQNVKPRPERRHTDAGRQTTNTYEDLPIGKATFLERNNRKTINETEINKTMGSKKRVNTMYEARNGLAMAALGDKTYKAPEY